MRAALAAWRRLEAGQPALARTGLVLAGLLAACLVAMLVDPREMRGVSVWVKPAKFAASLAVWCWSLAWAFAALAPAARSGAAARAIVVGTIAFAALEAGWITLRAGLGLPSHFAEDAIGAMAYGLMGLAALTLCLLASGFGMLVALRGDRTMDPLMRGAIAAGFLAAGIFGGLTGAAISAQAGPYVGGAPTDAGALPPFFWSRGGGDLRVAHFVAIHAMQVLPLLAWATRSRGWVAAGAIGWAALGIGAFAQAMAGRPLL